METNKIKTTIGVIGRISSGKSTIAKKISQKYDIPIVSFGKYLFDYSTAHQLPALRDDLQNLGEKFIQEDSRKFLLDVLNSQLNPPSMIIEGIRHLSICTDLTALSENYTLIFVDTPIDERYRRYLERNKEIDEPLSFEQFKNIDQHPVEMQIDQLQELCQFNLTPEISDEELFMYLKTVLHG